MATDLTPQAVEGFAAAPGTDCPYLGSSDSSCAWHVGAWLQKTGRPAPRDVRRSRGHKMWANDMLLDVSDEQRIERLK